MVNDCSPGKRWNANASVSASLHRVQRQQTQRWYSLVPRNGAVLFLLVWLWLGTPVQAELLEIQVHTTEPAEALNLGLEQALLRLAGARSPALQRLRDELLAEPLQPWLRAREQHGEQRFVFHLDRAILWESLLQAGVPVWVGARPSWLAWVVVEGLERRQLLGGNLDADGVLEALQQWARSADIPLVVPLGDLEDRRQVRVVDVLGGVTEAFQEPSLRYATEGILLLHVLQRADRSQARAWLVVQDREFRAEARAETPAAVAVAIANDLLGQLAGAQARVLGQENRTLVGIVGIHNFAEGLRVRARLEAVEAIRRVWPRRLAQDWVLWEVQSALDTQSLRTVLAQQGFVDAIGPEGPELGQTPWFVLQW